MKSFIDTSEDHHWTSAHTITRPDAYHSTTTTHPCLFEGCDGYRTQVRLQYHDIRFTVDYEKHATHSGKGRFISFRIKPHEVHYRYFTVETFPEKVVGKATSYGYTVDFDMVYAGTPCQPGLSPHSAVPMVCIGDCLIRESLYVPARISFCWPEHTMLKLWYDPARDCLPFKNRKTVPLHQPASPARCGFNPIMSGAYGPCCRSFLAAPRCQDADDVPASL